MRRPSEPLQGFSHGPRDFAKKDQVSRTQQTLERISSEKPAGCPTVPAGRLRPERKIGRAPRVKILITSEPNIPAAPPTLKRERVLAPRRNARPTWFTPGRQSAIQRKSGMKLNPARWANARTTRLRSAPSAGYEEEKTGPSSRQEPSPPQPSGENLEYRVPIEPSLCISPRP